CQPPLPTSLTTPGSSHRARGPTLKSPPPGAHHRGPGPPVLFEHGALRHGRRSRRTTSPQAHRGRSLRPRGPPDSWLCLCGQPSLQRLGPLRPRPRPLPDALNGVGRNTEGRGQVRDRPRGFGAVSHPPEPQTEQRATGPTRGQKGVGNRLEHLRRVVRADLRKAGARPPQSSVEIPTEITVTGTPIQVGQLTGPIGDPVGEGDDPCPCLFTGQPSTIGTALRTTIDVGQRALLSFASRHQCSAGVRTGVSQSSTSSSVTAVSVIEKPFMSSEVT